MGAWIEINNYGAQEYRKWSLPSWERGLKFRWFVSVDKVADVAPLVGAWIEIALLPQSSGARLVAPLVGAWIEIGQSGYIR